MQLTWRQVMAWRTECHHLHCRAPRKKMLDVIARSGGLHTQLLSSAELTLRARVEGLDPETVHNALWQEHTLVKTWATRGTLHLLPASELSLWHNSYSHSRVDSPDLERLVDGIAEALDGRMLTREELTDEVSRITGSAELGGKIGQSWGTMDGCPSPPR
jgi:hypothetical protein